MWTLELVEAEWEAQRYRRYENQIVRLAKPAAIRNLLKLTCRDVDDAEIDDLASRWLTEKSRRDAA
jgi:hypothetical protein